MTGCSMPHQRDLSALCAFTVLVTVCICRSTLPDFVCHTTVRLCLQNGSATPAGLLKPGSTSCSGNMMKPLGLMKPTPQINCRESAMKTKNCRFTRQKTLWAAWQQHIVLQMRVGGFTEHCISVHASTWVCSLYSYPQQHSQTCQVYLAFICMEGHVIVLHKPSCCSFSGGMNDKIADAICHCCVAIL